MADNQSQFRQDNREWLVWTIRDEIYAFVRKNAGPTIGAVFAMTAGAIWAFVKQYPTIWGPLGGAVFATGTVTFLALIAARKNKTGLHEAQNPIIGTITNESTEFSLHDLFLDDFKTGTKIIQGFGSDFVQNGVNIGKHDFFVGLYLNFDAHSLFMSLYIPANIYAHAMITWFSDGYQTYLADLTKEHPCLAANGGTTSTNK